MLNDNEKVTLTHGAGGKKTSELIHDIFQKHLGNRYFTADDAAVLELDSRHIAVTTDGFIVSPWQFPGGNIGELCICGTVNDLSCMGARPKYLTCAFQIEEGTPLSDLELIAKSMAETAAAAGVHIVAGDTKVAGKGQVDHCFITTTGVGERLPGLCPSGSRAKAGDAVIVTGDIGRHGCAILLARGDYGIDAAVTSDAAPLWSIVEPLTKIAAPEDLHTMRDATRGGVGTVLYEIAGESSVGIELDSAAIPVAPAVRGTCDMLGLEPLYLACEGRLVIFIPSERADEVLSIIRQTEQGRGAARIGTVVSDHPGKVTINTVLGTQTILPAPGGELLPRIC